MNKKLFILTLAIFCFSVILGYGGTKYTTVKYINAGEDINAVLDSNTKVILGPGTWTLSSPIITSDSSGTPFNNLVIQGSGVGVTILKYQPATIPCPAVQNAAAIYLLSGPSGCGDDPVADQAYITLQNFTLELNDNTQGIFADWNGNATDGYDLYKLSYVTIQNVKIINGTTGIKLYCEAEYVDISYNRFRMVHNTNVTHQYVTYVGASGYTSKHPRRINISNNLIYVYNGVNDVSLTNRHFNVIGLSNVSHSSVADNNIYYDHANGAVGHGIRIISPASAGEGGTSCDTRTITPCSTLITVTGNVIWGVPGVDPTIDSNEPKGISVYVSGTRIVVSGNTIRTTEKTGVGIGNAANYTDEGSNFNVFTNNLIETDGIGIETGRNGITISNNTIRALGSANGINVDGSKHITISGNTILGQAVGTGIGIKVIDATNFVIDGNTLSSMGGDEIAVSGTSSWFAITNNALDGGTLTCVGTPRQVTGNVDDNFC